MAETPSVSVIATVLNEVEAIRSLVLGLSQQTLSGIEIIIVDGGSTDGTWERLQELALQHKNLRIIRDESCNLKATPGPIGRGRNRAIREASSEVIACADAGCQYEADWAANLTAPIFSKQAEYALGGSCIDPAQATTWDLAAAPFLGLKLQTEGRRKSGTARSMAMRKHVWERVGGFPETTLFGEDTLFDMQARKIAPPVFPSGAMARYSPRFTLKSAAARLGAYAAADGRLGIRCARFARNLLRCVVEMAALIALWWTVIPVLLIALLEIYYVFGRGIHGVFQRSFGRTVRAVSARIFFSLLVPWIVALHYLAGSWSKVNRANPQNEG